MDSYLEAATAAAGCEKVAKNSMLLSEPERSELYLKAAKEWEKAKILAAMCGDKDNEHWAWARADWCLRGRGEWKFGGE